jgi:hypothetical protein
MWCRDCADWHKASLHVRLSQTVCFMCDMPSLLVKQRESLFFRIICLLRATTMHISECFP